MKILFIIPPFYRLLGTYHNQVNLGVLYLATVLHNHGFETGVYNADHLNTTEKFLSQREIFYNYKSFAHDIKNHDSFYEIKRLIEQKEPEYIGITITSATIVQSAIIAFIAKRVNKDIKVIVGGPHVTLNQDMIYEYKQIGLFDYCFTGESETKLLEFMQGVPVRKNPVIDIDELPQPNYDLVLNSKSFINYSPIITARGCPNKCTYCASSIIWNSKVRFRSVMNIMDEIAKLLWHTRYLDFVDDTFTLNKKRLINLLEHLKYIRGLQWECDTRIDRIDTEILQLMKVSGCAKIKIGIESGSQKILNSVNKKITIEQIKLAVIKIKKIGIPLTAYYMIGLPGETNDDIKQTIALAKWIDADCNSLSIYTPYRKASNFLYHQNIDLLKDSGISDKNINNFLDLAK